MPGINLDSYYSDKKAKFGELMAREITEDLGVNVQEKIRIQTILSDLLDKKIQLSDIQKTENGNFEVRPPRTPKSQSTNGVQEDPKQEPVGAKS